MTLFQNTRLAILISGRGSNMDSIISACKKNFLQANICLVISNNPDASGLSIASKAGLNTQCINHKDYNSRELFDKALVAALNVAGADIVALAGFMRILTPVLIEPYLGRLINIHPSLLPKYPGLNTHQRAINDREKEAGATVHFVTKELDSGPAIIQASLPILESDTVSSLATRVLEKEHQILPIAIKLLIEKKIDLRGNNAFLDGDALPVTGIQHE